jgi:hypothetical protein
VGATLTTDTSPTILSPMPPIGAPPFRQGHACALHHAYNGVLGSRRASQCCAGTIQRACCERSSEQPVFTEVARATQAWHGPTDFTSLSAFQRSSFNDQHRHDHRSLPRYLLHCTATIKRSPIPKLWAHFRGTVNHCLPPACPVFLATGRSTAIGRVPGFVRSCGPTVRKESS